MRKSKYIFIGIVAITLVLSTTSTLGFHVVDNENTELFMKNTILSGPVLEVTTDKYEYLPGEPVIIYLTNVGDETLSGGGPVITIYNENNDIVYQEATYCWHELEPGEYIEWPPWDQTDQQGQQVPEGEYIVEGYLSDGNSGGFVDDAAFYIGILNGDELDQSQTEMTENAALPVGQIPIPDNPTNFQVAQSFIPTKKVLTRVELYIGKNSTATYPLAVSIREELTEDDLTVIHIDPSQVPTEVFDWVEIDFDDITVTTGLTYYVVALTENVTDNFYAWGANNISESYPDGCAWFSIDEGDTWTNESASSHPSTNEAFSNQGGQPIFEDVATWDMCFKTYGTDNTAPGAPVITGETNGAAGTSYDYGFTSIDPDGDDIAEYIVDWGDDTGEEIVTGPFASGVEATASHTWDEQGDYTITAKAKDINGLIGPEGTLPVTMPVNQQASPSQSIQMQIMQRIFQQFPLIQSLLGI